MQPYFLPYIGYFQLINCVDVFVVYDNIKFTKKGWINRNRILTNGKDEYISLPLKNASDFLNVVERSLASSFKTDRVKMLRKISACYHKAPHFSIIFPLIESIIINEEENLFKYIFFSLKQICDYLGIKTSLLISSKVEIDHTLKAQDKVIAICKACHADHYINPIGGVELYSKSDFEKTDIQLNFIQSDPITYAQLNHEFIPWLSILDVMMFNSVEEIKVMLNAIKLV